MTLTPHRPTGSAGVVLRGSLSLLVLTVLLVGIPVALLLLTGSPLPSRAPNLDGVTSTLTSRDDGSLFIGAVKLITWLAWACFAVSCLTELTAFLRGRQAPSLPALDGPQRFAAYLIASIALAFTATSAQAANATSPPAHAAEIKSAAKTTGQEATAVSRQDRPKLHVVKPGENLWKIADEELGNGDRYKEIFKASRNLEQPDGVPALTNPRVIHPGERLAIPEDKSAAEEKIPDHKEPPGQGKTAEPDGHPAASAPKAPPSMTAPAVPLPTAVFSPPSAETTEAPVKVAVSAQESDSAVPAILYSGLAASGLVALLAMKRLIQQRRRRPGHRIRMPEAMSDSEWAARTTQTPDDADLLNRSLRTLAKNIAEAGCALPRIHGVKVGTQTVEIFLEEEIPSTLPLAPFRSTEEGSLLLDPQQVLPADELGEGPAPYPALVTLGSSGDRASVLVDLEAVGTVGLVGSPAETVEVLTAAAVELATSRVADHLDLLCVGFVPELPAVLSSGRLRHVSTVAEALADAKGHARDVAESLANAELSHARHARIALVAEAAWNPVIILSVLTCNADQLADLQPLTSSHGTLGAIVRVDPEEAAPNGGLVLPVAPDRLVNLPGLAPVVLHRVTSPSYEELLDDFTIASDVESIPDPRWHDVPPEPNDLLQHVVSRDDRPALTLLPAPADEKEGVPEQPREHLGLVPIEHDEATGLFSQPTAEDGPDEPSDNAPSTPYIRVLGRVEVQGRNVSDLEPGKRGLLVELAAYLRLTDSPSGEQLSRALGGGRGPWAASTRVSNVSRLRAWLGTNADGKPYVPTQRDRQIYSIENVGCDWADFEHLAIRGLNAIAAGDDEAGERDLQQAFSLVTDKPFGSASPDRYVWAEHLKQEMISGIVDVAHVLALTLFHSGRFTAARAVITKGLDIEPGSELLYRDWFYAEYHARNRQGLNDAAERLLRNLHDLGLEMEPETARVLDHYLNSPFQGRKEASAD
jgi:hypothetical protein